MAIRRQIGRTTLCVSGALYDASGAHLGLAVSAFGPRADIDALRMGAGLVMRMAGIKRLRLYEVSSVG